MQQALLTSAEDTESPTKSTCVDIEKCSESAPRHEQACRASLRGPVSILRVIGIPICDTDSKVPFYIICSSLWVLFFAMLIFAVIKPHSFTKAAVVANLVWLLHSTTIYTIVGVSMCSGADLLVLMADMASDNDDPKRATDITIDQSDMRKNAWMGSAYVYTGATANIIAVSIAFFNGYFYDFFPVIKSDFWLGFMIFMWVFYSVGSVLSVPFVYTPAMMLLRRVTKFVDLLEEKGEDLMGDFDRFSSWYDNLYKANKRLNKLVGLLITVDIGLCAPLAVFELLIVVYDETAQSSGLIWIFLNILQLSIICGVAAQIEGKKNKVAIAIGEQSLHLRPDSTLVHYQCMLSKIEANPLGIYVYGTTLRISSNNILKVVSIVTSLFFFFIGLRV